MKKTIFILLIIHYSLLITDCFTQWVQQISGTTNYLYEVQFINVNTGWACGDNGTILKTTNAGTNWFFQAVGVTTYDLVSLYAVDNNLLYCCGNGRTLLKTTNGGTNWLVLRTGAPFTGGYNGVFFINANTGWMGTQPAVLKTTNGGLNWDSIPVFPLSSPSDIYFKDNLNGVFCAATSYMFKTTNGGMNWFQVIVPVGTQFSDFLNLTFAGDIGWVVGRLNNKVYKTTNFGSTWDSLVRISNIIGDESNGIFFTNINTGYCGGTKMFKSTNGGLNWLQQVLPINAVYSIYFANDTVGWTVDGQGIILHTTNGGTYVGINPVSSTIPENFKLYQNYPNPFNNSTTIEFDIKEEDTYSLELFDAIGRKAQEIFRQIINPGKYNISYNADKLSSGIYFYILSSSKTIVTKKLVLIK